MTGIGETLKKTIALPQVSSLILCCMALKVCFPDCRIVQWFSLRLFPLMILT